MTTTKTPEAGLTAATALIPAIAAALPNSETHATTSGDLCGTARTGNRLVTFFPETDGTVRVAKYIDYGTDGRNWCDGRNYRSASGAIRFARSFLKTA